MVFSSNGLPVYAGSREVEVECCIIVEEEEEEEGSVTRGHKVEGSPKKKDFKNLSFRLIK